MSDPMNNIVMCASDLKVAAPDAYDRFVKSIVEYELYLKDQLMAAEPGIIFAMQGRTQQIAYLRRKLENCLKLRDDMLKSRRNPDGTKI